MSSGKTDLRVHKTRRALVTALLTLLEEQPFPKITVNDICKTALVSRAAFYQHFEDKYALLRFCLEELRVQMEAQEDYRDTIRRMMTLSREKARVFKNVLAQSDRELMELFRDSLVAGVTRRLEEHRQEGRKFPAPPHILALFVAGGVAHLMIWWLTRGADISPEEMAGHLIALCEQGACPAH